VGLFGRLKTRLFNLKNQTKFIKLIVNLNQGLPKPFLKKSLQAGYLKDLEVLLKRPAGFFRLNLPLKALVEP